MQNYNVLASTTENTVVSEYEPIKTQRTAYQSEADLENELIENLVRQGYEYLDIHAEGDLIANLRKQIERLNGVVFSEEEWDRFFKEFIANPNDGIKEKTRTIQEDFVKAFKRDDRSTKNIKLVDKENIHANFLQVIHQYEADEGKRKNRYDVTILVNGLPLVHVELKRRGVAIREAFNQINRYQRDSFWSGSRLFEYVQIFVISNGTNTKYYSNSTRFNHVNGQRNEGKKGKTSNSFEFTSFWADANNKTIPDLVDFTRTFFARHTLLSVLLKYCVFTADEMLLVMRPYQIAATEKIINKIEISNNYKTYGTIKAGGYVWHSTGSGKTLTSFKAARLATELPYIDKVLFVVDRKDLDYQTMREYDRFEKGAANSNRSTRILERQLRPEDKAKIIITTIQKLSSFIEKFPTHDVYNLHVVLIFDECHRSQFGKMHKAITRKFKKYHLFGFTGTPIFAVNASRQNDLTLQTTEDAFGERLHAYTIVDAINDKNVLPFRIDYIKTFEKEEEIEDAKVHDIDREKVYMNQERIGNVVSYVLDHFSQKTYRNQKAYDHTVLIDVSKVVRAKDRLAVKETKEKKLVSGFNSIFACQSVEAAKLYYSAFKRLMAENPEKAIKIGLIYSYAPNEAEQEEYDGELADALNGILSEENSDSVEGLDQSSRDFLDEAIKDYNEMFDTNYDTSSDKFPNYYKDVSLRMKNKELDMLIVVDMFLTGFDATTLNTLWVDKRLRMHGLIQAFSRTNRILNSIKTFGNVVCFRNLSKNTDEAVALYGDKEASGVVVLRPFRDYYEGYDDENGEHHPGYKELIAELEERFPLDAPILGEKNQKDFVRLFGAVLRMKNLLSSFDDFAGNEILFEIDFQDYGSRYLDIRDELKKKSDGGDVAIIDEDIVFETELLRQITVDIDYILALVQKYHDGNCKDISIQIRIAKAVDSNPELRNKKDLIDDFVAKANQVDDVLEGWREFVAERKEKELKALIDSENLKEPETRRFIDDCFESGEVKTAGASFANLLPPISMFGGKREKAKSRVAERIIAFFERFYGI